MDNRVAVRSWYFSRSANSPFPKRTRAWEFDAKLAGAECRDHGVSLEGSA